MNQINQVEDTKKNAWIKLLLNQRHIHICLTWLKCWEMGHLTNIRAHTFFGKSEKFHEVKYKDKMADDLQAVVVLIFSSHL